MPWAQVKVNLFHPLAIIIAHKDEGKYDKGPALQYVPPPGVWVASVITHRELHEY